MKTNKNSNLERYGVNSYRITTNVSLPEYIVTKHYAGIIDYEVPGADDYPKSYNYPSDFKIYINGTNEYISDEIQLVNAISYERKKADKGYVSLWCTIIDEVFTESKLLTKKQIKNIITDSIHEITGKDRVSITFKFLRDYPYEIIFRQKQILTVEKAKELYDKKIATTAPEWRENEPHARTFVVGEIISEWDNATRYQPHDKRFKNAQEYWKSYMKPEQIDEQKTRLLLLSKDGKRQHTAHTKYWNNYDEPTFTGSDSDRTVFYVEC